MTQAPQLDRGLPSDVACERTLLGAVLKNNDAWEQVCQLAKEDWSLESHQRIRQAMKRLKDAGSGIDELTLGDELRRRKELETIGGLSYLMDLQEGVYRNIALDDHLRIVRNKSVLRKLMTTCTEAISRAADQSETGLELTAGLMNELEKIAVPLMRAPDVLATSFIADTMAEIDREYQTRTSPCIPSGNPWFDSRTGGGYRQGNITLVCARPNVGKTPWAVMSIADNLKAGRKCVMFSLEKRKGAVLRDLIPYVANVPNRVVNNAWMQTPEHNRLIHEGMEILAGWAPLLSIYDQKMDRDQICWAIKRESKGGQDVLFVLDHFGMVAGMGRGEDPIERDNLTSGSIRDTIKDTNSAIVVLRQLRKASQQFAGTAPVADDVKGSGNSWEDAFAALIIHREIDAETKRMSRTALLNLAKLRTGGSTGSTKGVFNPWNLCFEAQAELEYDQQDFYQ